VANAIAVTMPRTERFIDAPPSARTRSTLPVGHHDVAVAAAKH